MDTETGHLVKYVAIFILVLISIGVTIYLIDNITGAGLVKGIASVILYVIPLGSLFDVLTHGSSSIPA
jgi:hypothetical protein